MVGQQFQAVAKDYGDPCGNIVFKETGNSYGYGRFITRFGLDENDVLLAEFDLSANVVYLSIGSEDLLYGSS